MFELRVKIKNSNAKYDRDFTVYEPCTISELDPIIDEYVGIAVKEFAQVPESIVCKIHLEIDESRHARNILTKESQLNGEYDT